jgi:hypothetical protein
VTINSEVEKIVNNRCKLWAAVECVGEQVREHERDLNGGPPSPGGRGRAPEPPRRQIHPGSAA